LSLCCRKAQAQHLRLSRRASSAQATSQESPRPSGPNRQRHGAGSVRVPNDSGNWRSSRLTPLPVPITLDPWGLPAKKAGRPGHQGVKRDSAAAERCTAPRRWPGMQAQPVVLPVALSRPEAPGQPVVAAGPGTKEREVSTTTEPALPLDQPTPPLHPRRWILTVRTAASPPKTPATTRPPHTYRVRDQQGCTRCLHQPAPS
jgi:hypothetical protein